MHKVGLSIIENPTNWKGQASLGHGGPLAGFVVRKGDDWRNEYVFSAPLKEFEKLIGKGILTIEVKIAGKRKWKHLVSEHFDFGEHPQHLQPMAGEGHVCGSTVATTPSVSLALRRGE